MLLKALIPIIFLFTSCSRSAQEEYEMSLRHVRQLLTDRNCGEALRITAELNTSGNRSSDPDYIYLRSSSFACNANYDDLRFFVDNFPLINNITDNNFHSALASFYNSQNAPGSSEYRYLNDAINTLFFPGDITTVSYTAREELFGERIALNFNTQILYMLLTKIGRYSRYYGNMGRNDDNQLVKGAGPQSNTCFTSYTTPFAQGLRRAMSVTNPCQSNSTGHPDMQVGAENRKSIMCEGVTMINALFNLINITLPRIINSRELDDLTNLNQEICTNEFGNDLICSVQTQSLCEGEDEDGNPNISMEHVESFMALYYDSLTDIPPSPSP